MAYALSFQCTVTMRICQSPELGNIYRARRVVLGKIFVIGHKNHDLLFANGFISALENHTWSHHPRNGGWIHSRSSLSMRPPHSHYQGFNSPPTSSPRTTLHTTECLVLATQGFFFLSLQRLHPNFCLSRSMPTSNERPGAGTPSGSKNWHEVVLRQKYNDPRKLKESLDTMYGQGGYQVKVRSPSILHMYRHHIRCWLPTSCAIDQGQSVYLETSSTTRWSILHSPPIRSSQILIYTLL